MEIIRNYLIMDKIKIKKTVVLFLIFIMFFSEIFMYNIDFLKYTDEIITVIFGVYIILKCFRNKITINKRLLRIIVCLIGILTIGIFSTLIYHIQDNVVAILLDIISFFKIFICAIGMNFLIKDFDEEKILKPLDKFAKAFLIIGFICSIISLFLDIGMRGQKRFGIYGFNFIYKYAHIYSMMILIACLVVVHNSKRKNAFNIFVCLSIVQMILTTKGPSIIWAACIIIFSYYFSKHKRFSVGIIILLILMSVVLGKYQIDEYLSQENSPRYTLYKYGFETANKYFPLGSGFASYGSNMAGEYYSDLYREYGFNDKYGMNEKDGSFLNDNYWPMVMGQFGWIGLSLLIFIVFEFYQIVINKDIENKDRAMILSGLFYCLMHSIGSSTFSTSACVLLFMVITILLNTKKGENNGKSY